MFDFDDLEEAEQQAVQPDQVNGQGPSTIGPRHLGLSKITAWFDEAVAKQAAKKALAERICSRSQRPEEFEALKVDHSHELPVQTKSKAPQSISVAQKTKDLYLLPSPQRGSAHLKTLTTNDPDALAAAAKKVTTVKGPQDVSSALAVPRKSFRWRAMFGALTTALLAFVVLRLRRRR
eukprot:gnl/MRDRNA2_/MRDRNA2_163328_c0_seq1.p1 gnl/MRDRNA2_/MRDRNA2_163328_c0~~gnl/MRDRNA2_/MRDRNA2_163328_c0_seq1.p1  ORF type:complete len:178 (-),score=44.09 gnl/MRDRNA2_/MRDRNA2_163328_c0_seq1:122-655(-)